MLTTQEIFFYTAIPIFTFLAGGIAGVFKKPNAVFRSIILHFAAGVIFSVVAVEILPDVIERHQPIYVAIGFIVGTVLMLLIKQFAEKEENTEKTTPLIPKVPLAFIVAIGVDILIDGLLLGIGFSTGSKAGILLAFALALEMLSMGVTVATELKTERIPTKTSIFHILLLSGLFLVSALLGATLLKHLPSSYMELVLSFGLSSLLYLVTEELLVEAHEEEDKPLYTATFFIGFLIFLLLAMIV